MPDTKLQMLLRGQNILGYKHYPDDAVRKFVEYSVKNGIDIIRIFDALNDARNLQVAIEETVKRGAIASGAISYTVSPVHTIDNFVKYAKELVKMGASTICIKDMAGLMSPAKATELVHGLKDALPEIPLIIHTHCTTGLAYMTLLKSVEAGADVLDTAISPFSGGTSQPATEALNFTLKEMGIDTMLDDSKLNQIASYFKPIRDEYVKSGKLNPKSMATDPACLTYQIPGGMISNLISQLTDMNSMNRFDEVLAENPKVRKEMGYPPLVTPTSQIIGSIAVSNVLTGKRYGKVNDQGKAYIRGEYGRTPAPIDPEIKKQILGDTPEVEGRYADSLSPIFDKTKKELGDKARSDEDVLSYIAFPEVTEKFFEERKTREENVAKYSIVEA
jgi:oxaloacetate decarboxylase alpha subunit